MGNRRYPASVRRRYPVLVALDHVPLAMREPFVPARWSDEPFGNRLEVVDAG